MNRTPLDRRVVRAPSITVAIVGASALTAGAHAQWDPDNGGWGKSDPAHLRVMTWNVRDNIVTTEPKTEGLNAWSAIARVLADLRPDVILLQECGDVGIANQQDTVQELEQVVRLLFDGGADPFRGGQVTSFVQKYAPGYSPQHVYVSPVSDGFNRNVIVSVFPFADLNGDGIALNANTVVLPADEYAPGGNGGIRGWGIAEIDLPDAAYAGDLVVGNSHLKSGGSASDRDDRLRAAQNIAYTIDYLFNGAGTGMPDPNGSVIIGADAILDPDTPVIWGGDLNEDEDRNGRKGPVEWMTNAQLTGGSDGTDRDRSDARADDARDVFTGSRTTLGSNKLDYILWQDSIAAEIRSFVLNAATIPTAGRPDAIAGFPNPSSVTSFASDHRPVIVDFALPLAPPCLADYDADGVVNVLDVVAFVTVWNAADPVADINDDGSINVLDVVAFITLWNVGCA